MQLFSFFVFIVIFSTSIGKYLLVDLDPKQEVSKESVDERCKEKKCGESCRPKPRVYGACDDNQQCVTLIAHPGCKDRERPGPLCEGPPDYGSCKPLSYGFTFDLVSKTCKKVAISGCGRTKNSFDKLEECEEKCSAPVACALDAIITIGTAPHCRGECPDGYIAIGYTTGGGDDGAKCLTGKKVRCCKGGPLKSGGEGDGEVDNIASIEKSDRAVSRCSDFRCPDERGGMCLREGASGCGAGEKCCDGLQCHSKTGICLGKGVTIRETLVNTRGCTECKGSCCDLTVTRKLNGTSIATKIWMNPRCADCKGSCCDFFSTMADRVPVFQKGLQYGEPVHVRMNPRCMDCRRIECCDFGRSVNVKRTSMMSYL